LLDLQRSDYESQDKLIGEYLITYLQYELNEKLCDGWEVIVADCQQQTNNCDCGPFILANSYILMNEVSKQPIEIDVDEIDDIESMEAPQVAMVDIDQSKLFIDYS
jgi:Ulp1 family protease